MRFSYDWPVQRQKEFAERNFLRYLKRYIFPYHPYYRKTYREAGIKPDDIRSGADAEKLPLTLKDDIREDPVSFVLQPTFPGVEPLYETEKVRKSDLLRYVAEGIRMKPPAASLPKAKTLRFRIEQAARREWFPIHFHASGGSTGEPTPTLYTMHDIFKVTPDIAVMGNLCGLEPSHKTLNLFPAAPHLAFFQVVMSQFLFGGNVFHACGGHIVPTERQITIAEKIKFENVAAIPSYLTYWLEVAAKMQEAGEVGKLDSFQFAVVGGEPIVPAYLARLKRQFAAVGSPHCKIIEGYGMTELKGAFYGCGEGSGIHLNAEHYHWEVLDPETKKPVPEGTPGVLVCSHVNFRGTVYVRYYTGDLINGMVWDKCPSCGLIGPRLIAPICRAEKDFSKIKGARVPMLNLQTAVRNSEGVETFQVVIGKEKPGDPFSRDWVKVYVAARKDVSQEAVERSVRKNVKLDCEISPSEVIFQSAGDIEARLFERTGLKADWIVDERTLPADGEAEEALAE